MNVFGAGAGGPVFLGTVKTDMDKKGQLAQHMRRSNLLRSKDKKIMRLERLLIAARSVLEDVTESRELIRDIERELSCCPCANKGCVHSRPMLRDVLNSGEESSK